MPSAFVGRWERGWEFPETVSNNAQNRPLLVKSSWWLQVGFSSIVMPFSDKNSPCVRCSPNVCCRDCNRLFSDSESLVQHLQQSLSHGEEQSLSGSYHCSICNKGFKSKNSFIQHLQKKLSHRRDLHHAACTGKYHFVVQLMRSQYANERGCSHRCGSNAEQIGFSPMHCAAFGGHKDCLTVMLNWDDGDPNVEDPSDGRTPVHVAAWKGNVECLRILLRRGGDPKLTDLEGGTALTLATVECKIVIQRHLFYGKYSGLP